MAKENYFVKQQLLELDIHIMAIEAQLVAVKRIVEKIKKNQ